MKNKIFKVCALGLVTTMIVTGCGSKEGNVKKIQKNEEISIEEKDTAIVDDNKYYGLEVYQFTNNTQLEVQFADNKDSILQDIGVINIDVLEKSKNTYEAVVSLEDEDNKKEYVYALLMKNDTDYILLYNKSENSNKEEIIKVGNELKEKFKNSKNYVTTFDTYVKENGLTLGTVYGNDGIVALKKSKIATNYKAKSYTNTDKKVKTVKSVFYYLSDSTCKESIEARTEDGELVWSLDNGNLPTHIGLIGTISNQVGNYYLLSTKNGVECRDIQTGKVLWIDNFKEAVIHVLIEINGKLIDCQGENGSSAIEIKDLSTGKTIFYEENINKYITDNENGYSYVDVSKNVVNGSTITFDVQNDMTESVKVGTLSFNVENKSFTFNKQ